MRRRWMPCTMYDPRCVWTLRGKLVSRVKIVDGVGSNQGTYSLLVRCSANNYCALIGNVFAGVRWCLWIHQMSPPCRMSGHYTALWGCDFDLCLKAMLSVRPTCAATDVEYFHKICPLLWSSVLDLPSEKNGQHHFRNTDTVPWGGQIRSCSPEPE